ncbi:putative repeat protein (TIGR01451 family) [Novosphingobium chloroacetimidivorans]|uniref:Putative repeat protein (TIGR01451 family) n=1 Tax=Novosphingobium chloroacetimidivorans TaxID=1428314 RepID=A0A7W7K9V4_9SPHN|nr:hypothetical protein [Novosphingobium chloroacetimidivorans]MBB4858899.1 putative repeat protein (TIGR01451 family) [Novosphingobium chloroacetimidivorans]
MASKTVSSKQETWLGALAAALLSLPVPHAQAATLAGTAVSNTASASYQMEGASGSTTSNTVATEVDEILDITLRNTGTETVRLDGRDAATFAIPFVLTNTGNGDEAFQLEAADPSQEVAPTVAIDVDGNGAYDPAVDITLSGQPTPLLAPGAQLNLLLRFARLPTGAGGATITARAETGSGAPGTFFAGKGDRGSDAVVGRTRAEATLPIAYGVGSGGSVAQLIKSQTVRAPDGTAAPVSGAVVTYRLALTAGGGTVLSDAEIVDPIPVGTAFVPGSIQIEDIAVSDVADADAAFFDGAAIHIALGEISQPTTRVVTFQVTIL